MHNIQTIIENQGIRCTAIRHLILSEIIKIDRPFTLLDLEDALESVDKSTIFRTLSTFLEHGLLHEIDNGSGSKLYCRCGHPGTEHPAHLHFTCTKCGKTYCIKDIDLSSIPHPSGFYVEDMSCVMKGLCPSCLK